MWRFVTCCLPLARLSPLALALTFPLPRFLPLPPFLRCLRSSATGLFFEGRTPFRF